MNIKTLSNKALNIIDQYQHLKIGSAVCSVPYFNNKKVRSRAGFRVNIGKGSPKEIFDEIQSFILKNHISIDTLADESLKKLLTDQNIGIDCSGFVYYVLNAESEENKQGSLKNIINFVNCKGLMGKIRAKLRPIENCDVATLSNDKNSTKVNFKEVNPGDFISILKKDNSDRNTSNNDYDHILIIHQVEYQDSVSRKLYYSHAISYPEDGIYGSGIKQGVIEIVNPEKDILEQSWTENSKTGIDNNIFVKARRANTEIRRIRS